MKHSTSIYIFAIALSICGLFGVAAAQKQRVRTVSIPISIFTKSEIEQGQTEELLKVETITVLENAEPQQILSIRSRTDTPLSLAILVQDGLASSVNLNLKELSRFIEGLPRGSRVMVAYMSAGSLKVRQKFTEDLTKAAGSFRVVFSDGSAAPRSPYDSVSDALDRFDGLPAGRRAILMISNGLDLSNGEFSSTPGQSNDLHIAIRKAQRKNVAVYSIFATTNDSPAGPSFGVLNGQASLTMIADETGGRTFSTGSITPISFDPFLRQLNVLLGRQFLLTYLSENMKKGFYKVEVKSSNPEVKIEHPRGYYFR
jgi:VWFA-related protein